MIREIKKSIFNKKWKFVSDKFNNAIFPSPSFSGSVIQITCTIKYKYNDDDINFFFFLITVEIILTHSVVMQHGNYLRAIQMSKQ